MRRESDELTDDATVSTVREVRHFYITITQQEANTE